MEIQRRTEGAENPGWRNCWGVKGDSVKQWRLLVATGATLVITALVAALILGLLHHKHISNYLAIGGAGILVLGLVAKIIRDRSRYDHSKIVELDLPWGGGMTRDKVDKVLAALEKALAKQNKNPLLLKEEKNWFIFFKVHDVNKEGNSGYLYYMISRKKGRDPTITALNEFSKLGEAISTLETVLKRHLDESPDNQPLQDVLGFFKK
jgi:hypothetical protein